MDRRREELRLTWSEVARLAGVSRETLRQIRTGEGEIRPLTRRGIEDALQWAPSSIDAIMSGGAPTSAAAGAHSETSAAPSEDEDEDPHQMLRDAADLLARADKILRRRETG